MALPLSIGVPVGTTTLDDFAETDCILFFGQNPGSNSPRMLHPLQAAAERGVPIITFNPLRERGLERFTNPQSPMEMLSGHSTRISSAYHQVKPGGDLAALTGICKAVVALDDQAPVLDQIFIAAHTHGFRRLHRVAASTGLGQAGAALRPVPRRHGGDGPYLRPCQGRDGHLWHGD